VDIELNKGYWYVLGVLRKTQHTWGSWGISKTRMPITNFLTV